MVESALPLASPTRFPCAGPCDQGAGGERARPPGCSGDGAPHVERMAPPRVRQANVRMPHKIASNRHMILATVNITRIKISVALGVGF